MNCISTILDSSPTKVSRRGAHHRIGSRPLAPPRRTPPMSETILVTGAAGNIGALLRVSLRRPERHLRLLDTKEQDELERDERATLLNVSFQDDVAFAEACRDVDALIHLGGLSTAGYSWPEYLEVNVNGTLRRAGSGAARGCTARDLREQPSRRRFHPNNEGLLDDYLFPRPDTLYGVSQSWPAKAFVASITIATASTSYACALAPIEIGQRIGARCGTGFPRATARGCSTPHSKSPHQAFAWSGVCRRTRGASCRSPRAKPLDTFLSTMPSSSSTPSRQHRCRMIHACATSSGARTSRRTLTTRRNRTPTK